MDAVSINLQFVKQATAETPQSTVLSINYQGPREWVVESTRREIESVNATGHTVNVQINASKNQVQAEVMREVAEIIHPTPLPQENEEEE